MIWRPNRTPLSPEEQHAKELERFKRKEVCRKKRWMFVLSSDGLLEESQWRQLVPKEYQNANIRILAVEGWVIRKEVDATDKKGGPHVLVQDVVIRACVDDGAELRPLKLTPRPKAKIRVDFNAVDIKESKQVEGKKWVKEQIKKLKKGDIAVVYVNTEALKGSTFPYIQQVAYNYSGRFYPLECKFIDESWGSVHVNPAPRYLVPEDGEGLEINIDDIKDIRIP